MSYQDHLRTCGYCSSKSNLTKPTIKIKSAYTRQKESKLAELSKIIKGVSYSTISYPGNFETKTKGASNTNSDKSQKLRELAILIKGT